MGDGLRMGESEREREVSTTIGWRGEPAYIFPPKCAVSYFFSPRFPSTNTATGKVLSKLSREKSFSHQRGLRFFRTRANGGMRLEGKVAGVRAR